MHSNIIYLKNYEGILNYHCANTIPQKKPLR